MNVLDSLTTIDLFHPETLGVVYGIAGVFVVVLLTRPRRRRVWWPWIASGVVVGAAIGFAVTWYVGDVLNAFDVPPTTVDRVAVAAAVAGIAIAFHNFFRTVWWRRVVASLSIVSFLLVAALAINEDGGVYQTVAQLLGTDKTAPLALPTPKAGAGVVAGFSPKLYRTWKAPVLMPRKGRLGSVTIPATTSDFPARSALVYLPPAALVKRAPALPVLVMMSGQPGSPSSMTGPGKLVSTLNAYAKKNHGLAPIVVIPDQLGASQDNPMCVNGPLGDSAAYITVDVTNWIRTHLRVEGDRRAWGVGGFSQGATCSIQFASGDPSLYGSVIDVSGQLGPVLSSPRASVAEGFDGDSLTYAAAQPRAIMAAHGRYDDTDAFFGVGQDDAKYGRSMTIMSAAAEKAGMHVTRYLSPNSAHDWTTASNGFAAGIGVLYPHLGLSSSKESL